MTWNISKSSFLVLSATLWTCSWLVIYIFLLPTEHESIGKKTFFRSEAEKTKKKTKLFHIDFDGSVGKPETRLFLFLGHRIALPCCGYSLESHWRCVFNEYPQHILWRNKQNFPLIITKYPPYLFHFLCAQRRLRVRCPLIEQLRSQGFFMRTAKTLVWRGGCPAWFEFSLSA